MPIARFQALPNHWLNIMISNWLRHILMATWHAICTTTKPKTGECAYKICLAWSGWCFVNRKSNAKIENHFMNATTTAAPSQCEHYRRIWWVKSCGVFVVRCSYDKRSEWDVGLLRLDYRSFIDIRHQKASTENFDWIGHAHIKIHFIHTHKHTSWAHELSTALIRRESARATQPYRHILSHTRTCSHGH